MDLKYFPAFLVTIFPTATQFSKEEIAEVGVAFKEYLQDKFSMAEDKMNAITDISPKSVIKNLGSPFCHGGYHPALVWHLTEFIRLQHEKNKEKTDKI